MNSKANKFSPEMHERAVRLMQECRANYSSLWATCESITPKIGCSISILNTWAQRAQINVGLRPGLTTDERGHLKQLEREVKELRLTEEARLSETSVPYISSRCA